jgi:hypothetical protein
MDTGVDDMAFYIKILKVLEAENSAQFKFESEGDRQGMFEFNKKTGEISLIEPMPDDEQGHYFSRASIKILREWRTGRLPEMTEWAS